MRMWGPIPGESTKAFAAFETFRDLGPARTLREAAGIHYGRDDGPSQGEYDTLRRWSAQHDWAERAQHFDSWLRMEKRDAIQRHMVERADEHARRETALKERALEIREKAAEKALLMLKAPLYKQERIVSGPDGEDVRLVMVPAGWSMATVAPLFALSQNNAGQLTAEEAEVSGELDFGNLSEAELRQLLELDAKIVVRNPEPERGREPR